MNIQPKFGHIAQVSLPSERKSRERDTQLIIAGCLILQKKPDKPCLIRQEGDEVVLAIQGPGIRIPLQGPQARATAEDVMGGNPFAAILHGQNLYLVTQEQEQHVKDQLPPSAEVTA